MKQGEAAMRIFWERLKQRTVWSLQGCTHAWKTEYSFRSWVWANLASALLVFILPLSPVERALILALGILVLAAELFNTAIENAVDYVSTDTHPLAKAAKDTGSAAVALTAFATGLAWIVILIG